MCLKEKSINSQILKVLQWKNFNEWALKWDRNFDSGTEQARWIEQPTCSIKWPSSQATVFWFFSFARLSTSIGHIFAFTWFLQLSSKIFNSLCITPEAINLLDTLFCIPCAKSLMIPQVLNSFWPRQSVLINL